eukprot:TRINITY_DN7952_c0_g2_i1.p5 TRINITY_DN7952_c0_g2~~TRINITY_DN7952_c0_g2_i1.p5  ORF type:complete len:129 (+),score=0.65 TRINITY_DN7952_c0_g2_i1:942-1328(+)
MAKTHQVVNFFKKKKKKKQPKKDGQKMSISEMFLLSNSQVQVINTTIHVQTNFCTFCIFIVCQLLMYLALLWFTICLMQKCVNIKPNLSNGSIFPKIKAKFIKNLRLYVIKLCQINVKYLQQLGCKQD